MKDVIKEIRSALKDKVSSEFFSSYCKFLESYENAIKYLSANASSSYDIFYKWFENEGLNYFRNVSKQILPTSLDERFIAFMNIYGSYLTDAIEDESDSIILDFLYIVPKRMQEDFEKFGYLASVKERYIWNVLPVYVVNNNCNFYMKPDIGCQASLI